MKAAELALSKSRRRIMPLAAAAVGLVAVLLWASCGGSPPMHYYTLETPSAPPPSDPTTNLVLGIEHFRGPEIMRDDRIVHYESSTQLNFYQQHRWSAEPTAMLAELCHRWLEQKGVFAEIRLAPYRDPVDYSLKGAEYWISRRSTSQLGLKDASASNSPSSARATGKWYFSSAARQRSALRKRGGGRG